MRLLLAALLLFSSSAAAQEFGQNHVVIDDFRWQIRSTEHFDIYYYPGYENLLPETARMLEESFDTVTKALDVHADPPGWLPPAQRKRWQWKRRPFFLYGSPNDFLQSNVAFPGDGTGGITEPFKDRFMVYHDGSRQWLEEVIAHEFTHIVQFHVLISGFWRSGAILKSIIYPLWMMEGMAGYTTKHLESALEEITIRDAATSGGLIPLTRLEHFGHLKPHQVTLAYKQGAAALDFLGSQYGRKKVGQMLKLFESRFETSSVLGELIGLDAFAFDKKYREFLEEKYDRVRRAERLKEPDAYGGPLTRVRDDIPQYNTSPVFTPDGRFMYFLSTRDGFPASLYEQDLRSGRMRRVTRLHQPRFDSLPLGNFANLSRVLSISPDGGTIAFCASRKLRDRLYLYDRVKRRLESRELEGLDMATQPRFSPDGRRVALSGMRKGVTDIYLYDLASGRLRRLTDDPEDDAMPAWTPDGAALIYSSEVFDPLEPGRRARRLMRVTVADGRVERLEDSGGEARDPVVSPDGKRVLFVREDGVFSEIAELDLATRGARRLTRTLGGSFTPAYAPDGELAFASLRRGSVHIYKGPRSEFLDEPLAPSPRALAPLVKQQLPGMGGVGRSTDTAALGPSRPYRFSASTDLFLPAAFYSSAGGFFWTSYWQGSDMVGNHQASALVSVASGETYDYAARYAYIRYRPQLFVGAEGIGRRNLTEADTDLPLDDAMHAQFAGVAYPFDRFHRVEASVASVSEQVDYRTIDREDDRQARIGSAALVRDTVRGRYLVPTRGGRLRLFANEAAPVLGGSRRYHTAGVEAHKFLPTGSMSAVAARVVGLQSFGKDHPNLLLGGLGGVRGLSRSTTQDNGSRLTLANVEWRFPVLPDLNYYMWYIFPDFYFKAVFGSVFSDAGYAWEDGRQADRARWREVRHSVGVGAKIYTFILQQFPLVIAMDYARTTNEPGGIFYVYLGSLF